MSNILEISGINKAFKQGGELLKVLQNISLSIGKGEIVALVGPSGSGKSTLLHIAGLLMSADSGSLILDGEDLSKANDGKKTAVRLEKIGFVYQFHHLLYEFNALENAAMPLTINKQTDISEVEKLLKQLGLESKLRTNAAKLSGGEQQRVAIARAFANNPRLILADEPTGALDSNTGKQVMDLFESLNKEGITIVLITHDLDIAKRAKRRITLKDGKIINDERDAA
jgi:ABC-type lipoprotein export system ATPase subunit